MPTNPTPAARAIRTELIAQGWLNIEDHGEVHKIIDKALSDERAVGEAMAELVEKWAADSECWAAFDCNQALAAWRKARGM